VLPNSQQAMSIMNILNSLSGAFSRASAIPRARKTPVAIARIITVSMNEGLNDISYIIYAFL